MSSATPQRGDRVDSTRIGGPGEIIGYQPREDGHPARWHIKPDNPGQLSRWLLRHQFTVKQNGR